MSMSHIIYAKQCITIHPSYLSQIAGRRAVSCTVSDVHVQWRAQSVTCTVSDVHSQWRARAVTCTVSGVHVQ